MKKKNIVFCHIEKCGGTSLQYLLRNNFPSYVTMQPTLYTLDSNDNKILTENTFKKFKLMYPLCNGLGGHRVKLYEDYFDASQCFKFTFLRDPIDRYISHFNYQKNVMGYDWDLESFSSEEEYNNFQVKRIANEENLEKAIDILQTNAQFVGLTEKFDESVLIMSYLIKGFKPYYETKNTAKERQEKKNRLERYPSRVQDKIMENNKLDTALYDYVLKNIFSKYQEDYRVEIQKDLEDFHTKNASFNYSKFSKNRIKINHYYSSLIQKIMTRVI